VVIAFGVLAMALMGFRDGSQQRDLASRHQAEIHYNRGLIYLEWGQYELAEAEFEEAVRLVPGYTEADDRRRLAQVKQTVTPSPTPSPSATPTATPPTPPTATPPIVVVPITQALFEESQAHYEHGEWEQAISKLEQLRAQDITYRAQETVDMLVQSHRSYALELEEGDNLEEAISHYDSALYLRRRDPELEERRRRADLYMKALGVWNVDWENVIVNLTALYALAPDYKDTTERFYHAATTYAQALIKEERYCAAAELYEQALNIRDDDPTIIQLEDDARHICRVAAPPPLQTKTPDGSTPGALSLGTIVATCYDHRNDQYNLCAQDAIENNLYTWLTNAEQPALTLDGSKLAYRSADPEHPGLYAVELFSVTSITRTMSGTLPAGQAPAGQAPADEASAGITTTSTITASAVTTDTTAVTSKLASTLASSTTVTATVLIETVELGTVVTITTSADAHYPTWSPDGTRVAYTQYDAEQEDWFIYLALLGSAEPPRRVHQGESPAWGPSGLLAFTTCGEENDCGIYVFDPASWALHKLTHSAQDRASGWSPSSDEIVYMSDIGRSLNLYVAHAQSGHIRQITRNLFTDLTPIWSPDGQRIAYVTNRADDWALYTEHPYGDQEERVASLGAQSADGQRFRISWVAKLLRFPALP
jgi:Tol biopolymer transport system component